MNLLLYGLQRSGTNYIEKLLTKRYRVTIINRNDDRTYPGAKHFRLYDNKNIVPEPGYYNNVKIENYCSFENLLKEVPDYCIVISKDPYSWLQSYKKWAIKCHWQPVQHHYIEEYNLFYGKWLELSAQTDKVVFIKYVDLLLDVKAELNRLEKVTGIRQKLWSFFATAKYSQVPQSDEFTQEHLDYYLNEQYFSRYTQEQLNEVNSHLDLDVISQLDYTLKKSI